MLEPVVLEMSIGSVAEWSLLRQYSPAVEEIRCKSAMRLIRLVRNGLQHQQTAGAVSDATLIGMMGLCWRPAKCCPHSRGPLRGLFRSIGIDHLGVRENLAHYEFAEEHWAAFLYCLKMRGGIGNIDLHGGSESFTLADNVNAAVTGKAPTVCTFHTTGYPFLNASYQLEELGAHRLPLNYRLVSANRSKKFFKRGSRKYDHT